jgi:tRNA threonylcarbamoyladenosine biosynthesis protein TsaB
MKLIAIETSTDICSIAYIHDGKCENIIESKIPRQHAEKLPLFYDDLVNKTGLILSEMDAIAVSIGPGSFTGLRIGLSYAKGLAYSHKKPIVPVPTIRSLLHGYGKTNHKIVVILLSHGNKYFIQQFESNNSIFTSAKIKVHELDSITELKNIAVESTIIQYGCDKLFEDSSIKNRVVNINPSAKWIGELAHQNYAKWIIEKPYKLVPNYVSPFKIG